MQVQAVPSAAKPGNMQPSRPVVTVFLLPDPSKLTAHWMTPFSQCGFMLFLLLLILLLLQGWQNSLSVERQTLDWKIASSNPSRSCGGISFSRVNFVCWLFFGVCSNPLLPQWHIKDPGHSAKSVGGRLHLNMYVPLTQQSQSGLTMLPSMHSVGTNPKTSSHATCKGTFTHSHLTSMSHCGLILA